jgi:hypothetical protein
MVRLKRVGKRVFIFVDETCMARLKRVVVETCSSYERLFFIFLN